MEKLSIQFNVKRNNCNTYFQKFVYSMKFKTKYILLSHNENEWHISHLLLTVHGELCGLLDRVLATDLVTGSISVSVTSTLNTIHSWLHPTIRGATGGTYGGQNQVNKFSTTFTVPSSQDPAIHHPRHVPDETNPRPHYLFK
jgi:hypothetical protein